MKFLSDQNAIEYVLNGICGKWQILIISLLYGEPKRFSVLQKNIPHISTRMLALDLRKLEETGIVSRQVSAEAPVKVEYALTPQGSALYPIIKDLCLWGQKYIKSPPDDTSQTVTHLSAELPSQS